LARVRLSREKLAYQGERAEDVRSREPGFQACTARLPSQVPSAKAELFLGGIPPFLNFIGRGLKTAITLR